MTPQQVVCVQASFAKVVPIAGQAAAMFYQRLFATAPELRALFPAVMEAQHEKLVAALAMVVNGLGDIVAIAPSVAELAVRHVGYGVRPEHYGPVGAALLWTLERGLGNDFTPTARDAWAEAYGALSGMMIAAAYADDAGAEQRP